MKILVHIGFLYLLKLMKLFIYDSFRIEHIPKEINKFIGNNDTTKSSSLERTAEPSASARIKSNIFRI